MNLNEFECILIYRIIMYIKFQFFLNISIDIDIFKKSSRVKTRSIFFNIKGKKIYLKKVVELR